MSMLVYLVCDHDAMGDQIRRILVREGIDCPAAHVVSPDLVAKRLSRINPDLVIVVVGTDPDRAMASLAELRLKAPARVLAVGPASDPKQVIRSLRAGADDYVDEEDLENHLQEALSRCKSTGQLREDAGRLITVLAPSGGSGSSTIAANVATVLAKQHERSALLDMKLEAGDLSALLDLKPSYTLADLCQNISRLDRTLFERTLVRHGSGVHLLAPPKYLSDVHHVTPEGIVQVLTLARSAFPYVIVDLDRTFREEQAEVLLRSDIILLVLRLDFTALRNTRRTLDYFSDLGIDKSKVRLVINRHGQAKEVPAGTAEEALGVKIFHYVPEEPKTVNRANNNGVPLVLEAPSAKVSKSVVKLAASVNGHYKAH
jgi:pilus assembly protein CpaE